MWKNHITCKSAKIRIPSNFSEIDNLNKERAKCNTQSVERKKTLTYSSVPCEIFRTECICKKGRKV